jgi:hypothetical protein
MGRAPRASRRTTRVAAVVALGVVVIAAVSFAQTPATEAEPCPPPPPPPSLPSVGVAIEVEPHETKPGTYEARALLTDALTGRRLSQSWVAVKVGSFADMRARIKPESGGGAAVDMYLKVEIPESEDHAILTTTYRKGGRIILKQETTLALGGAAPQGP